MGHLFIVTHTDLDGVGSAAVYVRLARLEKGDYTVVFAEPYNLDEILDSIAEYIEGGDKLVIADLGPNADTLSGAVETLSKLARRGASIEWYDHHVWAAEEKEAIKKAGVEVVVDRETCATGVVAKHAPRIAGLPEPDETIEELVSAVCAADLWRWDHHLAPKLFRVVGERKADEWKKVMIEKFASGILWDDEMEARLVEYVNLELDGFNRVRKSVYVAQRNGCRVASAYKENGPPSNSFIGAMLLSRYNAHIAVIARPNGAISLRSRDVDVQAVAKRLGGGGHPRASGAKIGLPLYVRLLRLLSPRIASRYVASVVLRASLEEGVCR